MAVVVHDHCSGYCKMQLPVKESAMIQDRGQQYHFQIPRRITLSFLGIMLEIIIAWGGVVRSEQR